MAQSLTGQFKAWLGKQNPGKDYDASDSRFCALAQFGKPGIITDDDARKAGIPVAVYDAALQRPRTFGALLDRLNALEAEKV